MRVLVEGAVNAQAWQDHPALPSLPALKPACPLPVPRAPPQVLRDFQEDPRGAQKHLKSPDIAAKINKLIGAGIIQVR